MVLSFQLAKDCWIRMNFVILWSIIRVVWPYSPDGEMVDPKIDMNDKIDDWLWKGRDGNSPKEDHL